MFILIPILLITGSAFGIFLIIWRKVPYLKKLDSNETTSLGIANGNSWQWNSFLSDFFPEAKEVIKRIKINEYKAAWLVELEKLLRKLRLFSLKMDRSSGIWISKIRNIHKNSKHTEAVITDMKPNVYVKPINKTELLKKEEQRLIIEIAKNPKDYKLYESLGSLYIDMGNYKDAKDSLEAALELNSDNYSIKEKLSLVSGKLKMPV